jgi:hypothetical protein
MLNGAPEKLLKHERGLRQSDPISPMLFILTMNPFQRILYKVTEKGILQPIDPRGRGIKISLYADPTAIFVKPSHSDIVALQSLLDVFGQSLGLRTNINKSKVYLIVCSGLDLTQILEGFPATVKAFPCRYLGLPLHPKKLRKIDFLPLLDKVGGKLPSWKGKLMTKVTRAQLVNSVLTSIVTYHVTVFALPKCLIKKIDKLRRNFLWKGKVREIKEASAW